jgi:hypothetical protein
MCTVSPGLRGLLAARLRQAEQQGDCIASGDGIIQRAVQELGDRGGVRDLCHGAQALSADLLDALDVLREHRVPGQAGAAAATGAGAHPPKPGGGPWECCLRGSLPTCMPRGSTYAADAAQRGGSSVL